MINYVEYLDKESAKMELESNDRFLIFYAVLIFTFITGMLIIISFLNRSGAIEQAVLSTVYEGMLFGILYCIWEIWGILRENHDIVYGTKHFPELQKYYKGRMFVGQFPEVLTKKFEGITMSIIFILFELLLFVASGWLNFVMAVIVIVALGLVFYKSVSWFILKGIKSLLVRALKAH